MKIAVAAASGELGRLVMAELLNRMPAGDLVAVVRSPDKVADLAARGVEVRRGDYSEPASLDGALEGIDRLLLISSSEVGIRVAQHGNVVDAAKRAGVSLIAYTSLLHADTSPMGHAPEHFATEELIRASGLPYAMLRHTYYMENYTGRIPAALESGVLLGSAGDGRISAATRADLALAAAIVLTGEASGNSVYELAGDECFTLSEFAAELGRQTGREIIYRNIPEADYAAALEAAGLPTFLAEMLAESDAGMAEDGLFDDSHQLSTLIGRPTTGMVESVEKFLSL
ncbi:SDR family oxidoreductase [Emcibacter nanhaiensis]|uniref:SDR family oxidoreductase n=1 Tax=Emcibacter nanhaiensis TaxID=1505037 RepID=A0A501PBY5_9PROT|nr:SDR family oxidoreductase [Emcibacter nanhaiensis]TPD57601.1 SDR family oxidoreductase [Emcibacter nanhaiensis]